MTGEDDAVEERLPHGYTNFTGRTGGVIRKVYQGPEPRERQDVEHAALSALAGRLPVPEPVSQKDGELAMTALPGVPGQEVLDDPVPGRAAAVLRACGRLRATLSGIAPGEVPGLPGAGPALVHGDFGPQNVLVSPDGADVLGLVDWEWAHAGDPVEDLAWAEWIVRTHHPAAVPLLDEMFAGYGERPAWADRRAAMLENCQRCLEFCRRWGDPGAVRLWHDRIAATERFRDDRGED